MESLEYEGWMATYNIRELPEAALPYIPITPGDFALSAMTQSSVGFNRINMIPFKFDSGASAPISPERGDFVNYRTMAPHSVKGLGVLLLTQLVLGTSLSINPRAAPLCSIMPYTCQRLAFA